MTEHTDKASRKSGKAAPKGQPGKSRSPKSKRAKAPASQKPEPQTAPAKAATPQAPAAKASDAKAADAKSLAPDPATITFGSNRPIVAAPRQLPEGSGLRFSGSSAGELKASGPQPTSAKAGGLTFTNAKPSGAKPNGTNGAGKPEPRKPEPRKPDAGKPEAADTSARKAEAGKSGGKTPESSPGGKTPESSKVPASGGKAPAQTNQTKPVLTKPAIAPQASGRRLEKERSNGGFVLTLLGLVAVVGVLAYWLNPGAEPTTPEAEVAAVQPAPEATPETAPAPTTTPTAEPPAEVAPAPPAPLGPSVRAPESPGPLAATLPVNSVEHTTDLSLEEIGEVQRLLDGLGLAPGNTDGILTVETEAAIRAYQEMAGLSANGTADKALLEELRSVAELYGS